MTLKLNLGCGQRPLPGYVNVDKFGTPDLQFDLETFPWPWADDSVSDVQLIHVLEHLGQQTDVYLCIIQELYRICQANSLIHITVPHPRHDNFVHDPTHVRAITPSGLELFSRQRNRDWQRHGNANTPLGLYLNVDFDLVHTNLVGSALWFERYGDRAHDVQLLLQESALYNNLIEEVQMQWRVVKPLR
ncbi:MAG: hypothetical protein F6K00_18715 [Leptolyngbya sp. SIOISBB]|nr:hypothetical protein [Leptolyngbya sp. SIOISBB]